ncbi:MAG: tripartite tricarboxylate transporter substrate binding protein [Burkholderiales bacterium]|nr:tripartite tricarboxylate transporter substrate binding protein [Burkholderiales bacterium]
MNSTSTRRRRLMQAAAGSLAMPALHGRAQARITRLVVGFAPGGPIDFVARVIAEPLGRELGHQVVVENKPGANAGIAADFVAKATPDGQTLFLTSTGAIAISPALYDKLPYDPVRDLTPVTLVVNTDEVLVASSSNPAGSVQDFLAAARQRKDGATMASSGIGSVPHLAMELLADVTRTTLRHVPYKGVAPAITDVIAGHVDALFIDVPVALSHIRAGKLKALAIAAPKRHPLLPDTRTLEESGISGVDSNNWYAVYTSRGTPAPEVERVNQALRRTLESEAVKGRLIASGVVPAPGTPAALAALQRADTEKWARIIRLKNIKGE